MKRYYCVDCDQPLTEEEYKTHCSECCCISDEDVDALREWIDPWHDASEPPEDDRNIIIILHGTLMGVGFKPTESKTGEYFVDYPPYGRTSDVTRWRNMPPLPEATHD